MKSDEDPPGEDTPGRYDDDEHVLDYGHEADGATRQSVMAVLKRYYSAAADGDGETACSLVSPKLVRSGDFSSAVPAAYVPASGSSVLRGSCPEVESLLFNVDHQLLAAQSPTLELIALRVSDGHGLAVMGFRTVGEHQIAVQREGGRWTVDELLDSKLP